MNTKNIQLIALLLTLTLVPLRAAEFLVEAESFVRKGGWVVDQQFMDVMGSSYLLAHGMGVAVDDARTEVAVPEKGEYHVYVRTYNWTSPWKRGEGPGKFALSVGGKRLGATLGVEGTEWMWQYAGKVTLRKETVTLKLHDLTGFDGRCDAIYFTTDGHAVPASDAAGLAALRRRLLNLPDEAPSAGRFDLVVAGGGVAGMSAALSAARLGCRVALINDRPVWGGNNSSEVRVHLGGRIEIGPYKALGALQKEFGPSREGNARPGDFYEDDKKLQVLKNEPNITLFPNFRAFAVSKEGNRIRSVTARHTETGEELLFEAPLFADCTGDGTVGFLAGADYRIGRESRDEFGESTAPETPDSLMMGASVQWYSVETEKPSAFPVFEYGMVFDDESCEKVTMGEWTWETGMSADPIGGFERIRDYGLLVVYSNWSYLKNRLADNADYRRRKLGWVAYVAGKRESRRLLGDYILKEDDLRRHVVHEDGTAAATWSIDLHYPDPENTARFPGKEFKSVARHIVIYPYPIPYRCFYSRNVDNLFMAGRNVSVTHVALGTVRVMRTTGMMGEVVGMAASLCRKHGVDPRSIYRSHLPELKALMTEGVGRGDLPNNQQYNEGGMLNVKPEVR